MQPQPGPSKKISVESLTDLPEIGALWIQGAPQEIAESVSEAEEKRQEAINEVIETERNFVCDLEYLRDAWITRIQKSEVIPPERRKHFIQQVFWNIRDILAVNTSLRDALVERQTSNAIIDRIGDIFLEHVPNFGPFVAYGAHQLYGKHEFEKEKAQNPAFASLVEAIERLPESRKLEFKVFLTKPINRLAQYLHLLETVLKYTPDSSFDQAVIPKVISMIKEWFTNANLEIQKTENRIDLVHLEGQLLLKPGEEADLRLKEPERELVYKAELQRRDGEILVFLLDHAILFTKSMKNNEKLKVFKRPIPLELLRITVSEGLSSPGNTSPSSPRSHRNRSRSLSKSLLSKDTSLPFPATAINEAKGQHWIQFQRLGRKADNLKLWANSALSQKTLVERIQKQQNMKRERCMCFSEVVLSQGFLGDSNKINCAAPFSNGRKIVYGTDNGVYLSDLKEPDKEPAKVLSLPGVSQVDVLEDHALLIVLSERNVITFPLEALDPLDPVAGLPGAKRISSEVSFFKVGFCLGRVLVCIVKSSQLSSVFKLLEPIDQNARRRTAFGQLVLDESDTLKPFREFYIPVETTSVHYFKTKMCVGGSRGFDVVDLETLETQGLLDPEDDALEFVRKRSNLKPMAVFRIHNEILVCYDEFAFYVNKLGRRTRKEFMVFWEGNPTGFALHEPYILAFDPNIVEIRHIETGNPVQMTQSLNLRLLFTDPLYSPGTSPGTQPTLPSDSQQLPLNAAYGHRGRDILAWSNDRVVAFRLPPAAISDEPTASTD